MKIVRRSLLTLLLSVLLVSCNSDDDDVPTAKKISIEFPHELLFEGENSEISTDYFKSDYYLFNPSSVYLKDDNICLSVDHGVYSFQVDQKEGVVLNYSIRKDSFKYLNYNSPNIVVSDSFNNVYVENIKVEEKVVYKGKSEETTMLHKTDHRIFKFDYEGNFLYAIGPKGKNDKSHFKDNETLELMHVDEFDNLSIIIKTCKVEESSGNRFERDNVDFHRYRLMKFDPNGVVTNTLDFSKIDELNIENSELIRVIQKIDLTASGDKIIVSTVDQNKIKISESEYYIESGDVSLFFYDLVSGKLSEDLISVENDLYYMFGVSLDDKIFLCRPDDVYGMRFMVVNFSGEIQENKKIIINNMRQKRYRFFFNKEGYIATIFLEDGKIRVTQYR